MTSDDKLSDFFLSVLIAFKISYEVEQISGFKYKPDIVYETMRLFDRMHDIYMQKDINIQ